MLLRKPLGEGGRHRHHVLGHRLGVGSNVARHDHPVGDPLERDVVSAGRQELHEPNGSGPGQLRPGELAFEVPAHEGVGGAERRSAVLVFLAFQEGQRRGAPEHVRERGLELRALRKRDRDGPWADRHPVRLPDWLVTASRGRNAS